MPAPARGAAGGRAPVPGARPGVRVAVAGELAPSVHGGSRRAWLTLPEGATGAARTTIHPSRRGRFDIDELVVRVEGPLGLGARQRPRHLAGPLRVYPPFR